MKSILTLLVVAVLLCPLSGAARAAERDPKLKPPPADTGVRPPREKPGTGTIDGDKGGTRPPREKPGTGGSGGDERPEEQDHRIIPTPPHWHPNPGICEYRYVEYEPRPLPSSSGNPLMDAYLLAISTTVVTNAATLFTDGNVRAFGAAGIAIGAASLVAAPFREDPSEQTAFALAGIASIVLGALNLDERSSHAAGVPYRAAPALVTVSF